ncbi:MAG: DUF4258 domain-containing protein [Chloroflexi bacterium]|nr:DUF4258 domain-containing protein [Chloroflexota bacterium]
MTEYIFSKHAAEMMEERSISEDWVWHVLNDSENKFTGEDGNLHFSKAIVEKEDRVLHVVVNPAFSPKRIVTLFFDRRLRSKQ